MKLTLSTGMMTGFMYGTYKQATAHFKFQNALEDPTGLEQALENVNMRMGAQQPLNVSLHFARRDNSKRPGQDISPAETADDWEKPDLEPSPSPPSSQKPGPGEIHGEYSPPGVQADTCLVTRTADETNGRWAEIRKANSGGATDSSWDKLRQSHERARISKGLRPDTQDPSGRTTQDTTFGPTDDGERVRQQAEFDALLEAERRIGQQTEGRFGGTTS